MRQPLGERVRDSLRLRALDVRDRIGGRGDRLVPPRRLGFADHSDFVAGGDEVLSLLVEQAGLQHSDRVLDVGCGTGRVARPLAGYLSSQGTYDGFDVNRDAVGWCRRRYARRPNFSFLVADLHNRRWNPTGLESAAAYRFPYDDGAFDVVIAASILTNLLEAEARNYLGEMARVLTPGGRLLASFFLLDADARAAIADGRAGLAFLDADAHVAVLSEDLPEEAVAYDEAWVRERLTEHGLTVREPVVRGSWAGRDDAVTLEDVLVAVR